MKNYLTNLRWPLLISTLLVLPFLLLELVNRWSYQEGFPIPLFGLLWLLPLGFILILTPVVRDVRAGDKLKYISFVLRIVLLILIAWLWVAIVLDQMHCFLGVPNCD